MLDRWAIGACPIIARRCGSPQLRSGCTRLGARRRHSALPCGSGPHQVAPRFVGVDTGSVLVWWPPQRARSVDRHRRHRDHRPRQQRARVPPTHRRRTAPRQNPARRTRPSTAHHRRRRQQPTDDLRGHGAWPCACIHMEPTNIDFVVGAVRAAPQRRRGPVRRFERVFDVGPRPSAGCARHQSSRPQSAGWCGGTTVIWMQRPSFSA